MGKTEGLFELTEMMSLALLLQPQATEPLLKRLRFKMAQHLLPARLLRINRREVKQIYALVIDGVIERAVAIEDDVHQAAQFRARGPSQSPCLWQTVPAHRSLHWLEERARDSESVARRALKELETAGAIQMRQGRVVVNHERLHMLSSG